jgi:hypothetical protein
VSTFDTDYLMVKGADLDQAVAALRAAGHTVADRISGTMTADSESTAPAAIISTDDA